MPELDRMLRDLVEEAVREEVARVLGRRVSDVARTLDTRILAEVSEYLSTSEAAAYARVSQGTVRRWVREGRLKRLDTPGEIRIRRDEVVALMHGGRRRRAPRRTPEVLGTPEMLAMREINRRATKRRQRGAADTGVAARG